MTLFWQPSQDDEGTIDIDLSKMTVESYVYREYCFFFMDLLSRLPRNSRTSILKWCKYTLDRDGFNAPSRLKCVAKIKEKGGNCKRVSEYEAWERQKCECLKDSRLNASVPPGAGRVPLAAQSTKGTPSGGRQ